MGLKDTFFKVLAGNNTPVDDEVKKSAEIAEKAVVDATQPEIEKVEEIIEPVLETVVEPQIKAEENETVDETTGISFITGEPVKELEEEPAVREDEVIDSSVLQEVPVEELVEINTETSPETVENVEEVENTTETVDTAENVNETVENIIQPIIDPTADDFENVACEENKDEQQLADVTEEQHEDEKQHTKIVIENELAKLEDALLSGIYTIFSAIRELVEKEYK